MILFSSHLTKILQKLSVASIASINTQSRPTEKTERNKMHPSSTIPKKISFFSFSFFGAFFLLLLLISSLPMGACSSPSSEKTSEQANDGGAEATPEGKSCITPSKPCLQGCGNELGVGMPCTKGGGECNDNPPTGAILCTGDFSTTDLVFCTRPCVVDEDCGKDALCTGDPENPKSGRGCFPRSCYTPPAEKTTENSPETTPDGGE